ncbi:10098_t:CDS:2, partial [Acaulospora colombiana]
KNMEQDIEGLTLSRVHLNDNIWYEIFWILYSEAAEQLQQFAKTC